MDMKKNYLFEKGHIPFKIVTNHEEDWENFFFLKLFNKQYQDINLLKERRV